MTIIIVAFVAIMIKMTRWKKVLCLQRSGEARWYLGKQHLGGSIRHPLIIIIIIIAVITLITIFITLIIIFIIIITTWKLKIWERRG